MSEQESHKLKIRVFCEKSPSASEKPIEIEATSCPITWGRGNIAELLGVEPNDINHVSWNHFKVIFKEDYQQFWIFDTSTNGIEVVVNDSLPIYPPRPYRYGEGFQVIGNLAFRIRKIQEPVADIEFRIEEIGVKPQTNPVFVTMPELRFPSKNGSSWAILLQALRADRAAHITGLPGTGKTFLASKLRDSKGLRWREATRNVGNLFTIWIDGDQLGGGELWLELVKLVVRSMVESAADSNTIPAGVLSHVRDKRAQLDTDWLGNNVSTVSSYLKEVLDPLVREFQLWPVLVFENFDQVYAKLPTAMLTQLLHVHRNIRNRRVYFVLITHRALKNLRADLKDQHVADFMTLFRKHSLNLIPFSRSHFTDFVNEIATYPRPDQVELLHELSGGLPALAKEIYEELTRLELWDQPEKWRAVFQESGSCQIPLQSCCQIWSSLTLNERNRLMDCLDKGDFQSLVSQENHLVELGLLQSDGTPFSPIFSASIRRLQESDTAICEVTPVDQDSIRKTFSSALEMAQRALTILEKQAAAYTTSTMPVTLALDLEDKRKEVEGLKRKLGIPVTTQPEHSLDLEDKCEAAESPARKPDARCAAVPDSGIGLPERQKMKYMNSGQLAKALTEIEERVSLCYTKYTQTNDATYFDRMLIATHRLEALLSGDYATENLRVDDIDCR